MKLRVARPDEKRKIYTWLACSDVTSSMMGPPSFPDHPIPSWEEFDRDYESFYFGEEEFLKGKSYIIEVDDIEVGVISYNELDLDNNEAELDIWLKSESVCGKGYGPQALKLMMEQLFESHHITRFVLIPSARNARAIAAYKRTGFVVCENPPERFLNKDNWDYDDCIVLKREYQRARVN